MNGNALRNGAPNPGLGCRLIATQARPPRRQPASAGLSPTTRHRLTVRLRLTNKGAALPAPRPSLPAVQVLPTKKPRLRTYATGADRQTFATATRGCPRKLRAGVLENYARVSSIIFFTVSWISVSFSSPGIHCWVITGTGISNLASCMACSTCLGPSGAQP